MHPLHRIDALVRAIARREPVKPAVNRGVRAAVAVLVPALAARLLHAPGVSWATLGGFLTAVADKGGSYRTRALTMGAVPILGAIAVAAAGLAGRSVGLAVAFSFLCVVAGGLAHVYGAAAGSVGGLVSILAVVSLAAPASAPEALVRGAGVLVGGLWVLLLALFLWPIRPYRPVCAAVAACYRAIADYAAQLEAASRASEEAGFSALVARHAGMRALIEAARAALASTRRGRQGESGRGERLLVLFQVADQLFPTLVALADALETGAHPAFVDTRAEAERAVAALAATAQEVARLVETEGRELRDGPRGVAWSDRALRAAIAWDGRAAQGAAVVARSQYLHAAALIARLSELARVAVETAATLDDERPAPDAVGAPSLDAAAPRPIFSARPLLDNLRADSVVLRHALRVGVATAIATAFARGLQLNRGYWVTVTVISVLQPYTGATFLKGLQRIAGTVIGGVFAAAIAAAVHDPRGILALVAVLAAISVSLLPINYGAFSMFLTPAFVLLAEVNAGDFHLVGVRIANTLLGGALALACGFLLWPSPERERFPNSMAAALARSRDLLLRVVASYGDGGDDAAAAIDEARRSAGLAISNAEASFQRLVAESRGPAEQLEPLMTMLTFARRFVGAVIALGSSRRPAEAAARFAELSPFARRVERALLDLEDAVSRQRPPEPLEELHPAEATAAPDPADPAHRAAPREALFRAQLERVARQLTVLHRAVERLHPPQLSAAPALPSCSPR